MDDQEKKKDIRQEFSLKLAEQLSQQKIGIHDAGKIIIDFNELLKEGGDCREMRKFIDEL